MTSGTHCWSCDASPGTDVPCVALLYQASWCAVLPLGCFRQGINVCSLPSLFDIALIQEWTKYTHTTSHLDMMQSLVLSVELRILEACSFQLNVETLQKIGYCARSSHNQDQSQYVCIHSMYNKWSAKRVLQDTCELGLEILNLGVAILCLGSSAATSLNKEFVSRLTLWLMPPTHVLTSLTIRDGQAVVVIDLSVNFALQQAVDYDGRLLPHVSLWNEAVQIQGCICKPLVPNTVFMSSTFYRASRNLGLILLHSKIPGRCVRCVHLILRVIYLKSPAHVIEIEGSST